MVNPSLFFFDNQKLTCPAANVMSRSNSTSSYKVDRIKFARKGTSQRHRFAFCENVGTCELLSDKEACHHLHQDQGPSLPLATPIFRQLLKIRTLFSCLSPTPSTIRQDSILIWKVYLILRPAPRLRPDTNSSRNTSLLQKSMKSRRSHQN